LRGRCRGDSDLDGLQQFWGQFLVLPERELPYRRFEITPHGALNQRNRSGSSLYGNVNNRNLIIQSDGGSLGGDRKFGGGLVKKISAVTQNSLPRNAASQDPIVLCAGASESYLKFLKTSQNLSKSLKQWVVPACTIKRKWPRSKKTLAWLQRDSDKYMTGTAMILNKLAENMNEI
jgi:hypothetical protein